MKTSAPCTCHTETDACASGILERPRYFPRQLLTPAELTLEQQYFRDKLRRHNRLIHGWGVVCGAEVCRIPPEEQSRNDRRNPTAADPNSPQPPLRPQPWKARVKPGYILGPYGDEILIDCERIIDLRTHGLTGESGEQNEPVDPWCAPVWVQRGDGPLYIAVRYKELPSRPVRVQPAGCGCDDTQCEYSRWRDGYEIGVLDHCPTSHEDPPNLDDLFGGPIPACPECPAEPWVVLARVELDGEGNVTLLDNCTCRRMAVGFGSYWWQCQGDACAIQSVDVEGGRTVEAGRDVVIDVKAYLPNTVTAHLGGKVTVKNNPIVPDAERRLRIEATAEADAEPGPRTLEIRDAKTNELLAARREALFVYSPAAAAQPAAPAPAQPSPAAPSPAPGIPKPETPKPSRPRKKEEKEEEEK